MQGHILPSQLRDVSWIGQSEDEGSTDGRTNVAQRHIGAYGFPAPYGHEPVEQSDRPGHRLSFNMDIVGGATASLCETLRECARTDAAVAGTDVTHRVSRLSHVVNLLFDRETQTLKVESPYTSEHGELRVTVKTAGALFVRLPEWAEDAAVLTLQGEAVDATPSHSGGYLLVPSPPLGQPLRFVFELQPTTLTLRHRKRDITVKMRGDSVAAMEDFGADLTFFDPL